jgi:hypothetical protein
MKINGIFLYESNIFVKSYVHIAKKKTVSPNWIHICFLFGTYTIQVTSREPSGITEQNLKQGPSSPILLNLQFHINSIILLTLKVSASVFALKRNFENNIQFVFHFVISENVETTAVHNGNDGFLIVLTIFNGTGIFADTFLALMNYIFRDVILCGPLQFYRCYGRTH